MNDKGIFGKLCFKEKYSVCSGEQVVRLRECDTLASNKMILFLCTSRAVMTDGETIGPAQLVIEPANLTVLVARSLSPWYHDVPDIDVEGKLHEVKVSSSGEEHLKGEQRI